MKKKIKKSLKIPKG